MHISDNQQMRTSINTTRKAKEGTAAHLPGTSVRENRPVQYSTSSRRREHQQSTETIILVPLCTKKARRNCNISQQKIQLWMGPATTRLEVCEGEELPRLHSSYSKACPANVPRRKLAFSPRVFQLRRRAHHLLPMSFAFIRVGCRFFLSSFTLL